MSTLDVSRLERIVVGLDGSTDSHGAALFTAALARKLGLEVIGVHAMGLLEAFGGGGGGDGDDVGRAKHVTAARERLEAQLNGPWRQPFVEAAIDHRVELRDGNPVHVLLATAAECDADMIVVGSKGAGGLAEQLMGSTATQIAERSAVPVVVVPGPHPDRGHRLVPSPT